MQYITVRNTVILYIYEYSYCIIILRFRGGPNSGQTAFFYLFCIQYYHIHVRIGLIVLNSYRILVNI